MSRTDPITGNQLTNALQALGIRFVLGRQSNDESLHEQPARLIAALAESLEARLRLSLIPLFLQRPEFAAHARTAAGGLNPPARLTLQCYYSAAVWLGQTHRPRVQPLPDLFSRELGLQPGSDSRANLRELARRHEELSGAKVNWLGTYEHAARIWLKGLEWQGSD